MSAALEGLDARKQQVEAELAHLRSLEVRVGSGCRGSSVTAAPELRSNNRSAKRDVESSLSCSKQTQRRNQRHR
jgi:hypothetical protein